MNLINQFRPVHQPRVRPPGGKLKAPWRAIPPGRPGFTLIEIIIVVAIVGLLAAIAVPSFFKSRSTAHTSTCINNLRQIDNAIQQWAAEQRMGQTSPVEFADIHPYLKGALFCPSGGTSFADSYSITTVAAEPSCRKAPLLHVWMGFELATAPGSPPPLARPGQ